jgi:hypothetical protein
MWYKRAVFHMTSERRSRCFFWRQKTTRHSLQISNFRGTKKRNVLRSSNLFPLASHTLRGQGGAAREAEAETQTAQPPSCARVTYTARASS